MLVDSETWSRRHVDVTGEDILAVLQSPTHHIGIDKHPVGWNPRQRPDVSIKKVCCGNTYWKALFGQLTHCDTHISGQIRGVVGADSSERLPGEVCCSRAVILITGATLPMRQTRRGNPTYPSWKFESPRLGTHLLTRERLLEEGSRLIARGATTDGADCLRQALTLWHGPYLDDFYVDWTTRRRDELYQRRLGLLEQLAGLELQAGAPDKAVQLYQQILATEPYLEGAHRGPMRCFMARGEPSRAIQLFRGYSNLLRNDLGTSPDRETLVLCQAILRELQTTICRSRVAVLSECLMYRMMTMAHPVAIAHPATKGRLNGPRNSASPAV
jgi:hypothetical protein